MDDGLTGPGPFGVVLPDESHSGFQHPPVVGFVGLEDHAISDVLEVTDEGVNSITNPLASVDNECEVVTMSGDIPEGLTSIEHALSQAQIVPWTTTYGELGALNAIPCASQEEGLHSGGELSTLDALVDGQAPADSSDGSSYYAGIGSMSTAAFSSTPLAATAAVRVGSADPLGSGPLPQVPQPMGREPQFGSSASEDGAPAESSSGVSYSGAEATPDRILRKSSDITDLVSKPIKKKMLTRLGPLSSPRGPSRSGKGRRTSEVIRGPIDESAGPELEQVDGGEMLG